MTTDADPFNRLRNLSKQTRAGAGSNRVSENLALLVERFDLQSDPPIAIGRDYFDQEKELRVFLRPAKNPNATRRRPEIEDFANGHGNAPAVQAGGIMLFKSCFPTMSEKLAGTYNASWGEVLSYHPNQASVMHMPTHVAIYPPDPNASEEFRRNGNVQVRVLDTRPSQTRSVEDMDAFKRVVSHHLSRRNPYYTYAVLRVTDPASGENVALQAKPLPMSEQSESPGEDAFERFMQTEQGQAIRDVISSGKASVEIIGAYIVSPGGAYKQKILGNESQVRAFKTMYQGDNHEALYVPSFLALRQGDTGAVFVTAVETRGALEARYELNEVPSEAHPEGKTYEPDSEPEGSSPAPTG